MRSKNNNAVKPALRSSIARGFTGSFRGLNLVWENKGLMPYLIVPFILNIIILTSIFCYSYISLLPVIESFISGSEWYMQFIRLLVSPVLLVMLAIAAVFVYSVAGGIISAPFLDLLSLKTEEILGIRVDDKNFSLTAAAGDLLRAVMNSLKLIILILFMNIFLLLLNILPGGSLLYTLFSFITALFFYGFQFYDYPLERRRFSFKEKLRIVWKFRWSVAGSGLAFFILSFIPIAGFLGLNICTTGAVITFAEDIQPELIQKKTESM